MSIVVRVIIAFLFVSFWACMITAWVKDYTAKAQAANPTPQAEAPYNTSTSPRPDTAVTSRGDCTKKDWVQEYKNEIAWAERNHFGVDWYTYPTGLGLAILANAFTHCR